jgi:hypothetical protein
MKTIAISIILLGTIFHASAQLVTNQPARLKFKVTEVYSGGSATGVSPSPDANMPGNSVENTVTSPGYEHKLKWTFVGRNQDKDIYNFTFTRTTKIGKETTSKEIQFDGKQIVVFKDDFHTVVMETPSAEDLKSAQSH